MGKCYIENDEKAIKSPREAAAASASDDHCEKGIEGNFLFSFSSAYKKLQRSQFGGIVLCEFVYARRANSGAKGNNTEPTHIITTFTFNFSFFSSNFILDSFSFLFFPFLLLNFTNLCSLLLLLFFSSLRSGRKFSYSFFYVSTKKLNCMFFNPIKGEK